MRTAAVALACLLALAATAGAAPAEDEARKLFFEGNALLEQGDYVGAVVRYRAAQARYPSARILLNLGTALVALGRNAEAVAVYTRYLEDPKADRKRKAEVRRLIAELEPKLARMAIVIDQPGARVLVNGNEVGRSPDVPLVVQDPGTFSVVAEKEGFLPAVASVAVGAGEVRTLKLELRPIAQEPPKRPAEPVPEVAVRPPAVAPHQPDTGEQPAEVVAAEVDLTRTQRWYADGWGWTVLSAGLAAAAVGSGVLVHGLGLRADAADEIDEGKAVTLNDSATRYKLAGGLLLAGGAALAIAGGVKLVIVETPAGRRVEIAASPGWLGIRGRL